MRNTILTACFFFIISFCIYLFATASYKPFYSYHHHVYVAQAFLHGRFDIQDFPSYYHDLATKDGKFYVPFGPTPAFFLIPFVVLFGNSVNPQFVSALFGALNVALVYLLCIKISNGWQTMGTPLERPQRKLEARTSEWGNGLTGPVANAIIVALFFAFGTVHFYATYIGSTWYIAQVINTTLLLLEIITTLSYWKDTKHSYWKLFVIGIVFGLAAMTRVPAVLSLFFCIALIANRNHGLFKKQTILALCALGLGILPSVIFQGWYNVVRFGSILQDGHELVYHNYSNFPIPTTIMQYYVPHFPLFQFLDIRNIPLHVYTAFFLPPKFSNHFPFMEFLPFGTSILITSPLLLVLLKVPWNHIVIRKSMLTAGLIMFIVFLHFMQGWVQFSYRYLLDFLPFLIIPLTAISAKTNKILITLLLCISIGMNVLGVIYGPK